MSNRKSNSPIYEKRQKKKKIMKKTVPGLISSHATIHLTSFFFSFVNFLELGYNNFIIAYGYLL